MFPTLTRDDVYRVETPRLWLRWPRHEDAASLATWVGKPHVATMTSTWPVDASEPQIVERIESARTANEDGRAIVLAITPKGDDARAIGMVGVSVERTERHDRLEFGYQLDPASWGRGLMTEAVQALAAQVFELTEAPKLYAKTRPDNHGSIKVLTRAGFVTTGGAEHESPLYGRYMVRDFELARVRPSALAGARRRLAGAAALAADVTLPE